MAAHRSRRHSRIHSHEALAFLPALDTGSGRLGPNGPSLAPVLLRVSIAKPKYLDTPEKGGNGIPAPWRHHDRSTRAQCNQYRAWPAHDGHGRRGASFGQHSLNGFCECA